MSLSRQTASAIAAFCGLAVFNLSITGWMAAGSPYYVDYMLESAQIAQAVLLAFWLVYGSGSVVHRLMIVGFLSIPAYFFPLLRAAKLDARWLIDTRECMISPLVGFGLALLLFGLGRALFRHRFVSTDESAIDRERQVRFTTRSFFAFTFLVGLLMVTMRLAWLDPEDSVYLYNPDTYPAICGFVMDHEWFPATCMALACLPIPFLLMNDRSFASTKTLLYCMFLLLAIFPFSMKVYDEIVNIHLHGAPWYSYRRPLLAEALQVAFSGGGLIAVMITGLSLIRARGIRLTRRLEPEAPATTG